MQCAKHPNIETNLACGKCGKPICPKCLVQTPVGMRCSECANLKNLPTYQVSLVYYLRAAGAGIGIALVLGFVWFAINSILPFFLLRFLIAAGVGYATGEVISLSVNRKRSIGLVIVSGISATFAFAIANILGMPFWLGGLYSIILGALVLALTIFMAVNRLR